jgi:hypothetical protein
MMGVVHLPGNRYPGQASARRLADAGCSKMFTSFVGLPQDSSDLGLETWYPSAGFWTYQSHTAQCAVRSYSGKTVGTLKGATR